VSLLQFDPLPDRWARRQVSKISAYARYTDRERRARRKLFTVYLKFQSIKNFIVHKETQKQAENNSTHRNVTTV